MDATMANEYLEQGELSLPEWESRRLCWDNRAIIYVPLPPQPEEVQVEGRGFTIPREIPQPTQKQFAQPKNMAPGYRVNNQSRRTNRSYVDHDVFEGLPVRNWRREMVPIAPPPAHEVTTQTDKWDTELPWGMPKDSHLLPLHSQDLLRAARSGRLYNRRPPVEEEEPEPETTGVEKPEKKEDPKEKGFTVRTWKLLPKHLEGPEIEYLAKRRKGITGQAIRPVVNNAPSTTKAAVRRTDAAGHTYVENVTLQKGQAVEGELVSQSVIPSVNVKGLVGDSLSTQPTQQRRRHPPPKRKSKRPARGRRRKLPLPPTSIPNKPNILNVEGGPHHTGTQGSAVGLDGIKLEPPATSSNENGTEDTEMADDSGPASDDEGDEGSDDEEGDGQGEGDEEADQNGSRLERLHTNETNESNETNEPSDSLALIGDNGYGGQPERELSSSPDLPLARLISGITHDHGPAGSPLKNVITFTSAYDERSPEIHGNDEAEAEGELDEANPGDITVDTTQDGYQMHEGIAAEVPLEHQHAYDGMLSTDRDGRKVVSMQHDGSYDDQDEMLLDGDESAMGSMDFSGVTSHVQPFPLQPLLDNTSVHMSVALSDQDDSGNISDFDPHNQVEVDSGTLDAILEAPLTGIEYQNLDEMANEGEQGSESASLLQEKGQQDTFEDLLGSLEDHLDAHDQAQMSDPLAVMAAAQQFKPATQAQAIVAVSEDGKTELMPDDYNDEISSIPVAISFADEILLSADATGATDSVGGVADAEAAVAEAVSETATPEVELVLGADSPASVNTATETEKTDIRPEVAAEVGIKAGVDNNGLRSGNKSEYEREE